MLIAYSGTAGFLFGGTSGILKGTTPFLFATASGIQTSVLGATFWACRSTFLHTRFAAEQSPGDFTKASTLAGGLSGGLVGLITRGRANVLPAAVMWSLFGCVGQVAYNRFSVPRDDQQQQLSKEGFWERMAKKSWSPVTVMSDEEYSKMLHERMLRVDAEIAILDDKLDALKKQQQEGAAMGATEEAKSSSTP